MASEEIIRWIREHLTVLANLDAREDLTPERRSERRAQEVKAINHLLSQINTSVTCPMKEACPMISAAVEAANAETVPECPMLVPKREQRGE